MEIYIFPLATSNKIFESTNMTTCKVNEIINFPSDIYQKVLYKFYTGDP